MARRGGLVRETSAFAVVRSMEPEVEVAPRRASGRRDRCGKASRTAFGGSSGGMPRPPSTNAEVCGGERHAPHRPAEAAERGDASSGPSGLTAVMFTDVVGSTRLAAAEGDAAWTARIRSHFALMRRDVEACGGDVVKSLGDGKMSVFGSARDAVAAARRIVESEAGGGQPPAPAIADRDRCRGRHGGGRRGLRNCRDPGGADRRVGRAGSDPRVRCRRGSRRQDAGSSGAEPARARADIAGARTSRRSP